MQRFNTVSTTNARNVFNGNGVTTVFNLDFAFFEASSLIVTLVAADGTRTVKTLTTDYTVSGGSGATGSVTTTSFTPATGEQLVVERAEPATQGTDYVNNDTFNAETTERRFDRVVMALQRALDLNQRAVKFPINEEPTDAQQTLPAAATRASKFLAFDASGDMIAATEATTAAITAFVATLMDDPDAATFLSTLGVSAYIQTLLNDADAATARATLGAAGLTDANVFTKTQTWKYGSNIAGASNLVLGDGNIFNVSGGTTTINTISSKGAGTVIILRFVGAYTLVHGAQLDLPGDANIVTAAGDVGVFIEHATDNWRLQFYQRTNEAPQMLPRGRPYFRVNRGGVDQTGVTTATFVKVQFNNELEDSDGAFDSSTNYRFTPQVPGLYWVSATVHINSMSDQVRILPAIYLNDTIIARGVDRRQSTGSPQDSSSMVSTLVRLNGSTDYVDARVFHSIGADGTIEGTAEYTHFHGFRIGD